VGAIKAYFDDSMYCARIVPSSLLRNCCVVSYTGVEHVLLCVVSCRLPSICGDHPKERLLSIKRQQQRCGGACSEATWSVNKCTSLTSSFFFVLMHRASKGAVHQGRRIRAKCLPSKFPLDSVHALSFLEVAARQVSELIAMVLSSCKTNFDMEVGIASGQRQIKTAFVGPALT